MYKAISGLSVGHRMVRSGNTAQTCPKNIRSGFRTLLAVHVQGNLGSICRPSHGSEREHSSNLPKEHKVRISDLARCPCTRQSRVYLSAIAWFGAGTQLKL